MAAGQALVMRAKSTRERGGDMVGAPFSFPGAAVPSGTHGGGDVPAGAGGRTHGKNAVLTTGGHGALFAGPPAGRLAAGVPDALGEQDEAAADDQVAAVDHQAGQPLGDHGRGLVSSSGIPFDQVIVPLDQ